MASEFIEAPKALEAVCLCQWFMYRLLTHGIQWSSPVVLKRGKVIHVVTVRYHVKVFQAIQKGDREFFNFCRFLSTDN